MVPRERIATRKGRERTGKKRESWGGMERQGRKKGKERK